MVMAYDGRPPASGRGRGHSHLLGVGGWKGGFSKKGPSRDGDYSRVGGWKGGFSKMGQAKMVMAMMAGRPAAAAICFSQFLRVGGWKGGFSKRAKRRW